MRRCSLKSWTTYPDKSKLVAVAAHSKNCLKSAELLVYYQHRKFISREYENTGHFASREGITRDAGHTGRNTGCPGKYAYSHYSKNTPWIWTTSALIVPSPISPTFQSSSNVLSLAAYLITRPLSTSCQPNSQLNGLSTPQKLPYCPSTTTLSVPSTVAKCHCLYY